MGRFPGARLYSRAGNEEINPVLTRWQLLRNLGLIWINQTFGQRPSNQNYNVYLKELADLSNINKHLTTHVARHTFATTVTLSNGVPIESVSKMLGHTSIKTTQIYAKVLDAKLSEDMAALQERMKLRRYSRFSQE